MDDYILNDYIQFGEMQTTLKQRAINKTRQLIELSRRWLATYYQRLNNDIPRKRQDSPDVASSSENGIPSGRPALKLEVGVET